MTKPKNWTPGKTKKNLKLWHKSKSEILTKLKNLSYLKTKNQNKIKILKIKSRKRKEKMKKSFWIRTKDAL